MLQLRRIAVIGLLVSACDAPQRLPVDLGSQAGDLGVDFGLEPDLGAPDAGDPRPMGPCGLGEPVGDEGLVLGTGRTDFRPVCSGDVMEWVRPGSQGGGHLEGALRLEAEVLIALDSDARSRIEYEFTVRDAVNAGFTTRTESPQGLEEASDGDLEVLNETLFIASDGSSAWLPLFRMLTERDPALGEDADPAIFDGRRLVYSATVTLPDGRTLTRTATVTSRCCQ